MWAPPVFSSDMEGAKTDRRWTLHACLALVLIGLYAAWPSLPTFKADDYPTIAYASHWSNVAHDFAGPQYDLRFFLFYRPLITLSLAVDHMLFGVEPAGFLAMNMLACIASALLLFGIFKRLLPGPQGAVMAWGLAAIWLVHPVLLQSTGWVVGRVDTHVAVWILLACWLHLRRRRGGAAWPVWLALCLGLMTKEYALGAPFLLLGLDFIDPVPVEGSGRRVAGRRLLALPTLLLIPAFLLLRKLVLGAALGGYGFLEGQPLDPLYMTEGIWSTLSHTLVPIGPAWLRILVTLLAGLLALLWIFRDRRGSVRRLAGALLLSAGLFAPLAPLLLSMRDPGQQRYAYLALIWPWSALLLGAWSLPRLRALLPIVTLAACVVLLVARQEDREIMLGHDRFVRSVTASLVDADAAMGQDGSPLLLSRGAGYGFHPQRFLWGLGSVLEPPFHPTSREVLSLRKLHPRAEPAPETWFTDSLRGIVPLGPQGAVRHPEANWSNSPPPALVPPVGFDGRLTPQVIRDRKGKDIGGWQVGEGYEGKVAVCTGFGSFTLSLAAEDGQIRLFDLLVANATPDRVSSTSTSGTNLVLDLLWNCWDLAKDSPISLYWRNSRGLQRAELRVAPDYPAWFWGQHR